MSHRTLVCHQWEFGTLILLGVPWWCVYVWGYQFRVPNEQSDFEIRLVNLDNIFFQTAYDPSSLVLFFIFTD